MSDFLRTLPHNAPLPMDLAWARLVSDIMREGAEVSPRGKLTKELQHRTLVVDMRHPVLLNPARKLNYRFMAAEAYWILSGDDRVETIAPYNPNIAQFSDDGVTFAGAYGPMVASQLDYVVDSLVNDELTRQATMTIWRPNPPPSKDIPCTVAINASLRNGRLNLHVFMRSSDAWLGVPYDVFNFTMIACAICTMLNYRRSRGNNPTIRPGVLYLTAASSHLYAVNYDQPDFLGVLKPGPSPITHELPRPYYEHRAGDAVLLTLLDRIRQSKKGDPTRWWETT